MKHLALMVAAGLILAFVLPNGHVRAQEKDALDGTWSLNVAKSKFNAGPTIKNQTRKYEVSGEQVKQTLDGIGSDGKSTHMTFTARYDGKEYPVSGNPDADTISVKRTDNLSARSVLKKDGKETLTTIRHVSKDRKTLTMTTTGTTAKGEKVDNVLVFERQ